MSPDDLQRHVCEAVPELSLLRISATNAGHVVVSMIQVHPDHRGQGCATRALQLITEWADTNGITLAVTAEPPETERRVSVARLRVLYRRFGFVPNKGRRKDFTISEGMYRLPRDRQERAEQ